MSSVILSENGLNVHYISDFIQKEDADKYLEKLKTLPFFTPTFRIRGKDIKPRRQVLAYGDSGLSYSFSGTTIEANPWTPLLLELRDKVEKQTACTFNFVLLNLYPDGSSYISHHKDNENELNASFPICALSFGSKRKIEFKKPETPITCINLEHGSYYAMLTPTNEEFSHGIAAEPNIKEIRISLTFRHIISNSAFFPLKKPKLNLDLFSISPEKNLKQEIDSQQADILPKNDWFETYFQNKDQKNMILAEFNLCFGTYVQIALENVFLRIHIRNFKETEQGDHFPTKNGVLMNSQTWDNFVVKLHNFNFLNINETFVSNNQLMFAFLNEEECFLQQVYFLKNSFFYLKASGIKVFKDQILKLKEFSSQITECLCDIILTRVIPNAILNRNNKCTNHLSDESVKTNFLTFFKKELENSVNKVFVCEACNYGSASQFDHKCMIYSMKEKFNLNRYSTILHLNTFLLAKNVTNDCCCHFSHKFFENFNTTFFESYLENVFN